MKVVTTPDKKVMTTFGTKVMIALDEKSRTSPTMCEFSVIGGGIAGLVAARRLARAGHTVTLYEASERLGGTVAQHTVGGICLDAGAESFATRDGTVAALAQELGLGDDIVAPQPGAAWLQGATGKPHPLPATSLLGIPAFPLASDVITAVGLHTALRAQLDALMPAFPSTKPISVATLVRRRMGRGMLEKLVVPVVHGVYSQHPDTLDCNRVAPGLRAAITRDGSLSAAVRSLRNSLRPGAAVHGIRGGVHRLVTALVAEVKRLGVDVRLGHRIDSPTAVHGTVIIAAPSLLAPTTPNRHVTLATLIVDHNELDKAPRGSGVLVADGHPTIRARALTHSTAKWEWLRTLARPNHVLRLSYDTKPASLLETATNDAQALLDVDLPTSRVLDFAQTEWSRPSASLPREGITTIGEAVAGSGLAAIIAHTNSQIDELLARHSDHR